MYDGPIPPSPRHSMSETSSPRSALVLGLSIILGLGLLGYLLGHAALQVKGLDRTVVVKGLSEREAPADTVIWPIRFQDASNELPALFDSIQAKNKLITEYLIANGMKPEEINSKAPTVTDLHAQNYGDKRNIEFRYTSTSIITVYSQNVDVARHAMSDIISLGRKGIAISGDEYENKPEFLFTKLNSLKPAMIAEATQNARAVAEKFAADSKSSIGRIKSATQGQFTIEDRDKTTPHVKKIRVVSTVEYYLAD